VEDGGSNLAFYVVSSQGNPCLLKLFSPEAVGGYELWYGVDEGAASL